LRGFGTLPRTWLEELRYHAADYAVILFSISLLLGAIVLSLWGYGRFWVPPTLLSLAGAPV
jgi:energy-coupling factor transport system permease protein